MNAMKRLLMLIGMVCFVSLATWIPMSSAQAQDADKITMDFVGFGVNPDFYAIVQGSKLSGKSLVIYKVGGNGPTLVVPLQGRTLEAALKMKEVVPYGISQAGVAGFVSPAGYQLGGQVIGENLQLVLSVGEESMTLGYATIFSNAAKTKYATVSIKMAYWTPDSRRVVIILNQKLDDNWSVDTDMIAAFSLG